MLETIKGWLCAHCVSADEVRFLHQDVARAIRELIAKRSDSVAD